jgi:hypothetical protein
VDKKPERAHFLEGLPYWDAALRSAGVRRA